MGVAQYPSRELNNAKVAQKRLRKENMQLEDKIESLEEELRQTKLFLKWAMKELRR